MRQYFISFSRCVNGVEVVNQFLVKASSLTDAFASCGIKFQVGLTSDKILLVYSEPVRKRGKNG